MVPSPHAARRSSWRVALALIASLAAALPLAVPAAAASLRGTVVDPDRRPVPGAAVRLEGPTGAVPLGTTDGAGQFSTERVTAGDYRLVVTSAGLRHDPVVVQLSDAHAVEVTVELRLAAVTDAVVVSASQVETSLSRLPASVAVLPVEELRVAQVETVADALRGVAGMPVARSGGRGSLTSVFPRGGESDYTLVLLDGVRLNAFGGGFDFGPLVAANLDRVEVVRGPQSALFGADAIGGVVQVVSRQGPGGQVSGMAEAGSLSTSHGQASASGALGAWWWDGGADVLTSASETGFAPAPGEGVTNDDVTTAMASGGLAYRRAHVDVRARAFAGTSERGYPGPYGSDPNDTYPGVDRVSRGRNETRGGSGMLAITPSARWRVRTDVTLADFDSDFVSPYGRSEATTRRSTLRAQVDAPITGLVAASAGVEALGEEATSTYIVGERGQPVAIARRVTGTFGELRAEAGRLLVTAGVRVEHVSRDAIEADLNPFSPRPALPADTLTSTNPRVAAAWFLRPPGARGWTRLRASAGTGIRSPDAFELAFTDNPDLRPERSRSYDVGMEQALAGGLVIAEATWFDNRYDDLIVAVGPAFENTSRYRTANIANARARGLELSAWARTRAGLELRAAYTWLDTAVLAVDGVPGEAPPPFAPGDPLIRRPRHAGTVRASLVRHRWQAFARLDARGETLDVDPTLGTFGGALRAPGFAVADVGGALTLGRGVEVFGRVGNLFDRRYEEVLGYPAPGRYVMAGVRVARGR